MEGSYQFFGVVIVRGRVMTVGGGGATPGFLGTVLARRAEFEVSDGSGQAAVSYSKCAIARALESSGQAAMLRSRGFVSLF